jgi:hypothetical protein
MQTAHDPVPGRGHIILNKIEGHIFIIFAPVKYLHKKSARIAVDIRFYQTNTFEFGREKIH